VGKLGAQLAVLQGRRDAVIGADVEQVSQRASLFVASMDPATQKQPA
jgi:hypothetical protein